MVRQRSLIVLQMLFAIGLSRCSSVEIGRNAVAINAVVHQGMAGIEQLFDRGIDAMPLFALIDVPFWQTPSR
jgi:hypothetical protein